MLFRPDTYIARCCYALCPILEMWSLKFKVQSPFLRYFVCDMLWAYALCMALRTFADELSICSIGVLSIGLCILSEVFQELGILNGTGDIWDVFFEGIAIAIAFLLMKHYERKGNSNEKEND